MNAKTLFKKTLSIAVSTLLAVGGSLVSSQQARAVELSLTTGPTISTSGPTANATPAVWVGYTLVSGQGWWQACGAEAAAESNLNGPPAQLCDNIYTSQEMQAGRATGLATSTTLDLTGLFYRFNGSSFSPLDIVGKHIRWFEAPYIQGSSSMPFAASTTFEISLSAPEPPTNSAPASFVLADGVATAVPGVWSSGSVNFLWLVCDNPYLASSGAQGTSPAADCGPFSASDSTNWITTNPLTVPESAWRWTGVNTRTFGSLAGKHLAVYEFNDSWVMSATQAIDGSSETTVTEQVSRGVERVVEIPKFQAPLFDSLVPQGIIGVSNNGGRLLLKDVKVTDIKSVTLNGTALTVVASKSGAAVKIPAGSKAGDLLFSMTDGTSITVPNAVKLNSSQVDEKLVDLKNLPKFAGSSVKVSATITKALGRSSALIKSSQNAKCVGYATANTAKARATALARATNVCAVITNINESIEPIIKVVVNKKLASTSPVKYQTW